MYISQHTVQCMGHSLNVTIWDISSFSAVILESFHTPFAGEGDIVPHDFIVLTPLCQQMSFSNAVVCYQKSCDTSPQLSMYTYLCNLSFHECLNSIFRGRLSMESPWWGVPHKLEEALLLKEEVPLLNFWSTCFLVILWSTSWFLLTDTGKTEVQKANMYCSSSDRGLRTVGSFNFL